MSYFTKKINTFYTDEKIDHARKNVEIYDWAKTMKDSAVTAAEKFIDYGTERLWDTVTSQNVPRSCRVSSLGSPVTGKKFLKDFDFYGWEADPIKEPWKLTDPSSGYKFPTNDFKSYYESGVNEFGVFEAEKADPQFLINELYPEKGKTWGVDNGFGWLDEYGEKWTFIAYYNHWHIWYRGIVREAIIALRDSYIFTGKLKYAEAGIILLDRISDVYPAMDSSVYKWEDGYINSHGMSGKGKILGCIWECELVCDLLSAYDVFFPAMEKTKVCEFLKQKSQMYHMENSKIDVYSIRKNIETNLFGQIFPAVKNAQIRGNFGMHQRALAMAAVILDDPKSSPEWIEWIFQTGGMVRDPELRLTGGNILATLVEDVDRDGFGNEGSPTYNTIWLTQIRGVADILQNYKGPLEIDLYKHVKMKKMYDTRHPFPMLKKYVPTIGDTGKTGNPFLIGSPSESIEAFEKYKDPIYAQFAYFLNNNQDEGIQGDVFSADPKKLQRDILNAVKVNGEMKFESVHLTGYGFTALRQGHLDQKLDTQRGLWMYYGRNIIHGHKDILNIGLHAYGLDLMPDLGYPETADDSPHRLKWVRNTISHNTVMVNRKTQNDHWVGIPLHFEGEGDVQLLDVKAPKAYPETEVYRRTVAYVSVDDENSYAIDFFRVEGGDEHHYSFHSAAGETVVEGLNLSPQTEGTLAGEQVSYGESDQVDQSGFDYLYNVQRDQMPEHVFSVDWQVEDTWLTFDNQDEDIHLRLTMLGEWSEVAVAEGRPPQKPGNPETLKYVIASRKGQHLQSQFVSLIEPYKNSRFIQSIAPVVLKAQGKVVNHSQAYALKVMLKDGRTDYVINSIDKNEMYNVDGKFLFQGFFGIYREYNAQPVYAYINEGTFMGTEESPVIKQKASAVRGRVVDFTRTLSFDNHIEVRVEEGLDRINDVLGKHIYVENDGERNAVYEITKVRRINGEQCVLSIGDKTLIRRYKNANHFDDGFIYDISSGANFDIPLSVKWKA